LREQTYRPSVDKAVRVIVPTQFTLQTLAEKYETPERKMRYIPVGIGASFTRAPSEEMTSVRRKYRLPDRFIYYPANPWPHKNHARLMAALRIYRLNMETAPGWCSPAGCRKRGATPSLWPSPRAWLTV